MATIHDVALTAGVSTTTVSRYLNNRIELPAATTARIDAAITKHDYRPNLLARRLSTGKTEAIGLLLPEISEPFFAALASAVEDEADRHGYTVFISSTHSDRAREVASLDRLQDHHVDGMIVLTNAPDDGRLAELISKRRNVVLLDEDIPGVRVPRVFVQNTEGAYAATRHLIEAGHRRIGYLGGPPGMLSTDERFSGYGLAIAEFRIERDPSLVRRGSLSTHFARQATLDLIAQPMPPTAIFASSDYLGLGAFEGLREAGISIPDEMSFVSFDDTSLWTVVTPAVTAIRQPVDALGRQGYLALYALMTQQPATRLTRLPVALIKRHSVAPPRHKDKLR